LSKILNHYKRHKDTHISEATIWNTGIEKLSVMAWDKDYMCSLSITQDVAVSNLVELSKDAAVHWLNEGLAYKSGYDRRCRVRIISMVNSHNIGK